MRRGLILLATLVVVAAGIAVLGQQPSFRASRLIICLLAGIFVAVAAWAAPSRLRNALIVISSLVFGLAMIEGATLALGLRPKVAAVDASLTHARPIVGWGPTKPGVYDLVKRDADGDLIYAAKATIDDHLNRKTVPSQGPRALAFFGDSFIFGDGVNDDGTLPQAFADLNARRIPVLNLAYSGWSPAQNLAALQADLYRSVFDKPRHFVLFTAAFHLERTACKGPFAVSNAPRYVLEDGNFRLVGTCANWATRLLSPLFEFARGFAVLQRLTPLTSAPDRHDVETYIKLIETFVATAKQKYDAKTTVLFWPSGDTPFKGTGFREAEVIEALRRADVDVLLDELPENDSKYRIPGDGHPTAFANKAIARTLLAHIQKTDPQALVMEGEHIDLRD